MKMKILCALMLAVLLVYGCGAKKATRDPARPDAAAALPGGQAEALSDEDLRYGVYSFDYGEETDEYGNYDSDLDDENAVVVCDEAVLHMKNAGISKSGNGTRDLFSGLNAAVAVIEQAHLLLDENSTVTTNGLGAPGIFCAGEPTMLEIRNSQIVTAGDNSPALICADGVHATVFKSRLVCEGANSPLIMTRGDVELSLWLSTLSSEAAPAIEVHGGQLQLDLWNQMQLTGNIQLVVDEENPMPVTLDMTISEGSSFAGAILAGTTDIINITLDETSTWTLTGEVTIAALAAPDTEFLGIQSNGFNIYYNAELVANAWLESQAYRLPGGGFLSPLI